MIVATENATHPRSTKSRDSDFSVSRGTNSNSNFGLFRMFTEKFQCLDFVVFAGVWGGYGQ